MFWYFILGALLIPKSIQSRFYLDYLDNQPIAIGFLLFSLISLKNLRYKAITIQLLSLLIFYKLLQVLVNFGGGILDILQILVFFNAFALKVRNNSIYVVSFLVFTIVPLGLYWSVGGNYGEFGFSLITSRLTSTYGGPNVVGFVNVLIFIALAERKEVLKGQGLFILLSLTGLCIFLSASRGAILTLSLYLFLRNFRIALVLGSMISLLNIDKIVAFSRILNGATSSDAERIDKLLASVENISIFGNGPGTVPAWYFKFNDLLGIGDPHSMYLVILLEEGIFGFIFYLVIFLLILSNIEYNKYLIMSFLVLGIISSDFLKNPAVLVSFVLASKFIGNEKISPRPST